MGGTVRRDGSRRTCRRNCAAHLGGGKRLVALRLAGIVKRDMPRDLEGNGKPRRVNFCFILLLRAQIGFIRNVLFLTYRTLCSITPG